jgi:hypothetical protein
VYLEALRLHDRPALTMLHLRAETLGLLCAASPLLASHPRCWPGACLPCSLRQLQVRGRLAVCLGLATLPGSRRSEQWLLAGGAWAVFGAACARPPPTNPCC